MSESHPDTTDRLGIVVSMICAIHCALLPVVVLLLPAAGAAMGDERLEWGLLTLAGVIAIWSVLRAASHHHHSWLVVGIILAGLALLVLGRVLEETNGGLAPAALSVVGAGFLVFAHVVNLRLCRQHQH